MKTMGGVIFGFLIMLVVLLAFSYNLINLFHAYGNQDVVEMVWHGFWVLLPCCFVNLNIIGDD